MSFALRLKKTFASSKSDSFESLDKLLDLPFETTLEQTQEIVNILGDCDKWEFDIRKLKDATEGRELITMTWSVSPAPSFPFS